MKRSKQQPQNSTQPKPTANMLTAPSDKLHRDGLKDQETGLQTRPSQDSPHARHSQPPPNTSPSQSSPPPTTHRAQLPVHHQDPVPSRSRPSSSASTQVLPDIPPTELIMDENELKKYQFQLLLSQSQLSQLDSILRSTPTLRPSSSPAIPPATDQANPATLPQSPHLLPHAKSTLPHSIPPYSHPNQSTLIVNEPTPTSPHTDLAHSASSSQPNAIPLHQSPANSPSRSLSSIQPPTSPSTIASTSISLWKQQLRHPELLQKTNDQHPGLIPSPTPSPHQPTQHLHNTTPQPDQASPPSQHQLPASQLPTQPQQLEANSNPVPSHSTLPLQSQHPNLTPNLSSSHPCETQSNPSLPIPTATAPAKLTHTTGGVFFNPQHHISQQIDKPRSLWCKCYRNNRFSWAEIQLHNTQDDCWLVVQNEVYDVTSMLNNHPGGVQTILKFAGMAADRHYFFHSPNAHKIWDQCKIGVVFQPSSTAATRTTGGGGQGCSRQTSPDLCNII